MSSSQLADQAVHGDELSLEDRDQEPGSHEKGDHPQRQPHIRHEHHDDREEDVRAVPDTVHHSPGDCLSDLSRVAHHPRVDIAHAVLVEIGKRQRLQVAEGSVPQIPVDAHLHRSRVDHRPVVDDGLESQHSQIQRDEPRQALQGPFRNVVVQHVAAEKRIGDIHNAADERQKDHPRHSFSVWSQIGDQSRNAEQGQGYRFRIAIHNCCLSSVSHPAICRS